MLKKVSHIGIAVYNIDESLKLYRDAYGMNVGERIKVPDQGVEVIFLHAGRDEIELLQPLDENANINKFLQKKGEGIHHICYEVEDIELALKQLEENGIQLIDKKPRRGATGDLVAFLHPKTTGGVLVELEQKA